MDECIDVGTNACVLLYFTEPSQSYFWQTCLIVQECARWSLGYFLHASKCCILPCCRSSTHCISLPITLLFGLSLSLPVSPFHTHTQAERKSTHTFSLNTLNLNSLLIRRYVTSLTLPSSPSFSPPILCTHPCLLRSSLPLCFFPSPFIFTRSSSLALSFLPFTRFFLSVPAPSEEPVSTQQPRWKQCLIWKLIKSVFLPVFLLLFSSQACLSGWETAVTLSQMNLPYVPCGSSWNTVKLVCVLHFYTSCGPQASGDRRRLTPCNSEWQHLIIRN